MYDETDDQVDMARERMEAIKADYRRYLIECGEEPVVDEVSETTLDEQQRIRDFDRAQRVSWVYPQTDSRSNDLY